MDALSDMLRSVRLTGGVFLDAKFTAPWGVTTKITGKCVPVLADATQIIGYHFVVDGGLLLSVDDEEPIEVRAGEIVLLPRNDFHTLASAAHVVAVGADDLIEMSPDGGMARIRYGGGGPTTHVICGFLASNERFNPLIAALPSVLKLDVREGTQRDWIEASVRFAAEELAKGRLPSSEVMSRLSELLLVEAVRHYAAELSDIDTGWLKGLRDPQIGQALALIHQDIGACLSVGMLAREVALSRTAFIDRFRTLVGMPPIRYVTACRLQAAKLQLRESAKSVAQLAHAVGYESEEAFSRAFKREFGLSPVRWREHPDYNLQD